MLGAFKFTTAVGRLPETTRPAVHARGCLSLRLKLLYIYLKSHSEENDGDKSQHVGIFYHRVE